MAVGVTHAGERTGDFPSFKAHGISFALVAVIYFHPLRESVYDGRAHAVKTAGDFIAASAELTARVEYGEHYLESRFSDLVVDL